MISDRLKLSSPSPASFDPAAALARLKPGRMILTVEAGVHQGAALEIEPGLVTIGSELDNDVVLLGEDVLPRHLELHVLDGFGARVRVQPVDGPVTVDGGRRLDSGQYADLVAPFRMTLGDTSVQLAPAQDYVRMARLGLPVIGVLVLAVLGWQVFSGGRVPVAAAPPASLAAPPGVEAATAWRARLAERLQAAGLAASVVVDVGPLGNLVASGSIDADAADRWRDVVKWLDAQADAPLLVNNVSRGGAATDTPQVRSVWLDARPQVILSDGRLAGIGDQVGGGWTVEAIEADGVVFARAGRTVRVTF